MRRLVRETISYDRISFPIRTTPSTLTRNASRRMVNVEPDLQRISDDMYQCHQLPPGDSERLREARVGDHKGRVRSVTHFLTSSLRKSWKVVGTVWKQTPTIFIVVRTHTESFVNTLSVIQDIDQRICPTVVQAARMSRWRIHFTKWLGRINSFLPVL